VRLGFGICPSLSSQHGQTVSVTIHWTN